MKFDIASILRLLLDRTRAVPAIRSIRGGSGKRKSSGSHSRRPKRDRHDGSVRRSRLDPRYDTYYFMYNSDHLPNCAPNAVNNVCAVGLSSPVHAVMLGAETGDLPADPEILDAPGDIMPSLYLAALCGFVDHGPDLVAPTLLADGTHSIAIHDFQPPNYNLSPEFLAMMNGNRLFWLIFQFRLSGSTVDGAVDDAERNHFVSCRFNIRRGGVWEITGGERGSYLFDASTATLNWMITQEAGRDEVFPRLAEAFGPGHSMRLDRIIYPRSGGFFYSLLDICPNMADLEKKSIFPVTYGVDAAWSGGEYCPFNLKVVPARQVKSLDEIRARASLE